nr:hypothetical protein [Fervidicoccus fontis]
MKTPQFIDAKSNSPMERKSAEAYTASPSFSFLEGKALFFVLSIMESMSLSKYMLSPVVPEIVKYREKVSIKRTLQSGEPSEETV